MLPTMSTTRTTRRKIKTPKDYPTLTFRPSRHHLDTMAGIKELTGLRLGAIVNACLANHLPVMLRNHKIKV